MIQLGITLAVGGVAGFLFFKLKVPGGMMVGALLAVSVLSVFTDFAYMPSYARVAAQITAGAFIACTVEKSDLKRLPHIVKPAAILLGGMLCLNLVMGFVIHGVTGLDWITSFMCAVPGGMSDTPIIAADMGGNGGKVAVMQFARLLTGIGLFPSLILAVTRKEKIPQREAPVREKSAGGKRPAEFALTAAVAGICGVAGKLAGIPVGALLFSLIGVIGLKLLFDKAYLPMWVKRAAQVLSGCYIGSSVTYQDVVELRDLIPAVLLLLLGYTVACLVVGSVMVKVCGMSRRESMLAATPAGASDMALISADLGIQSPDLIVLQVVRMLVVISVFPQIINLLVGFLK
ncbi:MAG: AbrB family transcriptional regulator [Anaerotignum sp.]|nr:AbrB family transcriptional regulator [Anaerotignum sp.]